MARDKASLSSEGGARAKASLAGGDLRAKGSLATESGLRAKSTFGGLNDLTASLFANTQVFHAAAFSIALTAASFANTQSFGAHTIGEADALEATKFTNSQSFGTHAVSFDLTATSFTNQQSFGSHTIAEAQELEATKFANAQSFGSHALSIDLTATSFANTQTFGSHAFSVEMTATSFANAQTFGSHEIAEAGIEGDPDLEHSIHSGLAWFMGSHPAAADELGTERISDETMSLGGSAAFGSTHPDIGTWRSLATTGASGDYAASTLTAAVAALGDEYTVWADVVVTGADTWSNILAVPWDQGATWDSPWVVFNFSRNSSNTSARHGFTPSSSLATGTGADGSFPTTNGRRRYWMTRSGTTLKFGVDGAQVGSDITVASGAPNWAGSSGDRVTVGNRSPFSTGEFFDAQFLRLMVWNRALTSTELSDLNTDPQLGLFT